MRRSALRALRSSLAAVREEGAGPLVRTAAHCCALLLSFPHASAAAAASRRPRLLRCATASSATAATTAASATAAAAAAEQQRRASHSSLQPVSWASLALVSLTGAGMVTLYNREKSRRLEAALAREPVKTAGKAAVGGPWALVDESGRACSNEDLKGAFALLYFGFTHCPDICPDELLKLAEAVDKIEKETGSFVTPVFLSLDPKRDSVAQVRQYVKEFHPRMRGMTGSEEACAAAARAFRVYHHRTEEVDGDYLVDHSIIMYLLDPDGDFVTFFGKNVTADELAQRVGEHVRKWVWPVEAAPPPPPPAVAAAATAAATTSARL